MRPIGFFWGQVSGAPADAEERVREMAAESIRRSLAARRAEIAHNISASRADGIQSASGRDHGKKQHSLELIVLRQWQI